MIHKKHTMMKKVAIKFDFLLIIVQILSIVVSAAHADNAQLTLENDSHVTLRGSFRTTSSERNLKHSKKEEDILEASSVPIAVPVPMSTPVPTTVPMSTPSPSQPPIPLPTWMPEPEGASSEILAIPEPTNPPTPLDLWNSDQDTNGFLVSTCNLLTDSNVTDSPFSTAIDFEYYLYLNNETAAAQVEDEILNVEVMVHEALTKSALTCNFEDDNTTLIGLSSEGADSLDGECLDPNTDIAGLCWQVKGQITVVLTEALSDPELVDTFFEGVAAALDTAVDGVNILAIELRGSSMGDLDNGKVSPGTSLSGNGPGVSAAQSSAALNEPSSQTVGPTVIAIAAVALVLLTAFLIHRRKRNQNAAVTETEEVTDLALETSPSQDSKHDVSYLNGNDILVDLDTDGLEVMNDASKASPTIISNNEMTDGTDFSGFEVVG